MVGSVQGSSGPGTLTTEEIFDQYAPRIFHLARRMLGNDADAEDVTQDVFVNLLRHLDEFRGESAFLTWLHRITVNAALSFRRKRALRETEPMVENSTEQRAARGRRLIPGSPWPERPENVAEERENQKLVDDAIGKLPEEYRDVIVLADLEGWPSAEVAECLGTSVPAVKSRLHRARLALRRALAPHFEENP